MLNLLILLYAKELTLKTILTMLASTFALMFANFENDLYDVKIDERKGVRRKLVSKRILILLVFLSTSLAFFLDELFGVLVGICILLSHAYNSYLSRKVLVGNLAVAFTISLGIFSLGFVFGFRKELYELVFFAFILNLHREIVKTYLDRNYDLERTTIAHVLDERRILKLIYGLNFSNAFLTAFVLSQWLLGGIMLLEGILNAMGRLDMEKHAFMLKIFMLIGFITVLLPYP